MADSTNKGKGKGGNKPADKPADNSPKNQPKKDNTPAKKESKAPADKPQQKVESTDQNKPKAEVTPTPAANVSQPAAVKETTPTAQGGDNAKPAAKKSDKPKEAVVPGKGTVKSVISGDTVVIINLSKNQNGPPSETILSLSSITAPSMGSRRKPKKDDKPTEEAEDEKKAKNQIEQPYAWESRNFLRKLVIGQQVTYIVENKAPSSNKCYGLIFTQSGQNVTEKIVENGFASVRDIKGQPWAELQELINLQDQAKKDGRGMWGNKKEVRKVPVNTDTTPSELYDKLRGKPVSAVVEQVITGSTLRLELLPSHHEVVFILSGVEAPLVDTVKNISQPFGREAKFFSEFKVLNRDVEVFLEGADRNNLYGTLTYKEGGDKQGYLSLDLLAQGLGKYVEWSGARTGQFSAKLQAAEKDAKTKQLRVFQGYSAPTRSATGDVQKKGLKAGKEIVGKVTEIMNSTCIVVVDAKNEEHKIFFSSVRPRKGNKESKKEALEESIAQDSKEYLRKRLIGQKVRCVFDYTQPSQPVVGQTQSVPDDRNMWTVYLEKNNIGVELAEQGFVTVTQHKGGEQRARDYELLLFAEGRATKSNKGLHTKEDRVSAASKYVDIADVKLATERFPGLQRLGKQRGVVDYEFSATRIKLLVPKEQCKIVLALQGITTGAGPKEKQTDAEKALATEARLFVKEKIHQHDVEFDIHSKDKGYTYIGNVWVGKESLAALLLEQGFVKTYRSDDRELLFAENIAKQRRKGIWKDFDPEVERAANEARKTARDAAFKKSKSRIHVVVTEIVDGGHFYAQIVDQEDQKDTEEAPAPQDSKRKKLAYREEIAQLEELMKQLAEETSTEAYTPKINDLVKAQFTEDDAWYRAKVIAGGKGEFRVQYIDYGNSETIKADRIRKLDAKFTQLRPQSYECTLAFINVRTLDEEYGKEAAEFFKELVWGKTVEANIESREGKDGEIQKLALSLSTDPENGMHVNAAMLHNGLARVARLGRRDANSDVVQLLREEEKKARETHSGIWEYGDPGSDEDDDAPRGGRRN